ncbi:MAG: carbohydrate binding family 9 domain-containing protein [Saprospiraceae bacterium]|nr:carbohydrate binding family 9 domain-containing protein [Saprospiraceae bacterium]
MKALIMTGTVIFLTIGLQAQSQLAEKRHIEATRISEKIKIDAELNESIWQNSPIAENFVFMWPTPGQPATQKTQVMVAYDDAALYIAARCFDTQPDSIFHRLSKRDVLENTDAFSIMLDTYRDGQNAVQFGVTPDNIQFDSKYSLANANPNNGNNDGEDPSWDAVWTSAAKITDKGWIVELEIPFSAIRFPKKQVQSWGLNFLRSVKRRGETDSWNEIKAEIAGTLNQMGVLDGISNIKAPLRLSATPFLAGYANNAYNNPSAPHSSWSYPWSMGMDIKYGINEAFTLDATVIPDFGQVRSDRNVLNLSPFEVRFDENRPFFTEGTELFNKGGLFYSRRVGANAQLLNATKISGRTKKGMGVGVFNAIERAEFQTVVVEGKEVREQISPVTNKSVLVFDQNLKHNSSVTLISTNVLASGAALDANVSGLLFNFKNKAQSYALNGKAVASNRFMSDGRESGFTASLNASKTSGNFLWGSEFNLESDQYNPNDLGFLFSPNEVSHLIWLNYNQYKPWWKLNNYWSSLWMWNGGLYKPFGAWTERLIGFNFGGNTRSFHNFGFNGNLAPWGERDYFEPRTYDFETYYHVPAYTNLRVWYNSDHRKNLVFNAFSGVRLFDEKDRRSTYLEAGLRWRASGKLSIGFNMGSEFSHNNVGGLNNLFENAAGFENVTDGQVIMGRRNIIGFDNVINGSFSFNNKMNLTLYVRHYWQKVEYSGFNLLDGNGHLQPTDYTGISPEGESLHDMAANFFNVDLVYTWRFAPGSDLLLVYKNGVGHFDEGRLVDHPYFYNVRRLPDFEGTNNFSIKILYFLDYERIKKAF